MKSAFYLGVIYMLAFEAMSSKNSALKEAPRLKNC